MQPEGLKHPYTRFLAGIYNRRYYKHLFEEVLIGLSRLCLNDLISADEACGMPPPSQLPPPLADRPTSKKLKSAYRHKKKKVGLDKFGHVIELCTAPLEKGLCLLQLHFTEAGFYAERVTPSCLLAKFRSCTEARRALKLLAEEFVQARSFSEATDVAKAHILKSPVEWARLFKPKPQSDGSADSDKNDQPPDRSAMPNDRLLSSSASRNPPTTAKSKPVAKSRGNSDLSSQSADLTLSDSGQRPRIDLDVACRFVGFHLGLTGKMADQREAV